MRFVFCIIFHIFIIYGNEVNAFDLEKEEEHHRSYKESPRIITVGSCLSTRVSEFYCKAMGGKVMMNIEYFRKDLILGELFNVPGYPSLPPKSEVYTLEPVTNPKLNKEFYTLLRMQYDVLPPKVTFSDWLQREQPNLLIMDPYPELAARTFLFKDDPSKLVLLNDKTFKNTGKNFTMENEEKDPSYYISCLKLIITKIREICPYIKVVLINIPIPSGVALSADKSATINKAIIFENSIKDLSPSLLNAYVPMLQIPKYYIQSQDIRHYDVVQYLTYAVTIRRTLDESHEKLRAAIIKSRL